MFDLESKNNGYRTGFHAGINTAVDIVNDKFQETGIVEMKELICSMKQMLVDYEED